MRANGVHYRRFARSTNPFLQHKFITCYGGEEEVMKQNDVEKTSWKLMY